MSAPEFTITILPLNAQNVQDWVDANVLTRGGAEVPRLSRFWDEAEAGTRVIFVAYRNGDIAGHVTVQDESLYMPFRRHKMPEIVDLWVQPDHRRFGVGRAFLLAAEGHARAKGAKAIGLGVGITDAFGPAHRLYASLDYKPDGMGAWANGVHVKDGDTLRIDDTVLFMWAKDL